MSRIARIEMLLALVVVMRAIMAGSALAAPPQPAAVCAKIGAGFVQEECAQIVEQL